MIMQGFYCSSREEFDDLCQQLDRVTVGSSRPAPLIEVHSRRPAHFPPAQPYEPTMATASGMAGKCLQAMLIYLNTVTHSNVSYS